MTKEALIEMLIQEEQFHPSSNWWIAESFAALQQKNKSMVVTLRTQVNDLFLNVAELTISGSLIKNKGRAFFIDLLSLY